MTQAGDFVDDYYNLTFNNSDPSLQDLNSEDNRDLDLFLDDVQPLQNITPEQHQQNLKGAKFLECVKEFRTKGQPAEIIKKGELLKVIEWDSGENLVLLDGKNLKNEQWIGYKDFHSLEVYHGQLSKSYFESSEEVEEVGLFDLGFTKKQIPKEKPNQDDSHQTIGEPRETAYCEAGCVIF